MTPRYMRELLELTEILHELLPPMLMTVLVALAAAAVAVAVEDDIPDISMTATR